MSAKLQKGEALNERGHWLVDETVKRAAEEFDMAWLKDFPKNGQDLTPAPEAKYPT